MAVARDETRRAEKASAGMAMHSFMALAREAVSHNGMRQPEVPLFTRSRATPVAKLITGVPHSSDWLTIEGPASSVDGLMNAVET